jgi:chorismate synthase
MLEKLRYLTAGESHGKGLLGIIDGIPAHLEISEEYIRYQLSRRQRGHGRSNRMKIESDFAELYCGVRQGRTNGGPIGLIINNKDYKNWSECMSVEKNDYSKKVTLPRPGHADLAGTMKFGFDDIRDVIERSSARETAMRVAISSICRKMLEDLDIQFCSRVIRIHDVVDNSKVDFSKSLSKINFLIDKSDVRCLDKKVEQAMIDTIDKAKRNGDSVGGIIEIYCTGLPFGLGSYTQWDKKLQSKISESLLSINAFKGIEFGMGFDAASKLGSDVHDEIIIDNKKLGRRTNNAGGIEGGMSNTQPLAIRLSMKPIPTLTKPLDSVDIQTNSASKAHRERTDSCAVPAASIIAENLLCVVIADAVLSKFGGDSMDQLKSHIEQSGKF